MKTASQIVPRFTAYVLIAALLTCAVPGFARKKPKGAISPEIHPDMLVEIHGLEIEKARKPCDNWAWWAAVQSTLEQQNLPLSQAYFVDHNDGGACLNEDHPLTLYDVATSVASDYALPNGQTFHADVSLGKTTLDVAMIVAALRAGRPLIMVWRDRPYLVQGILIDDQVYPGGQHSYLPKELQLINPADGKTAKVSLDEDNARDIAGVMDVVVTRTSR